MRATRTSTRHKPITFRTPDGTLVKLPKRLYVVCTRLNNDLLVASAHHRKKSAVEQCDFDDADFPDYAPHFVIAVEPVKPATKRGRRK